MANTLPFAHYNPDGSLIDDPKLRSELSAADTTSIIAAIESNDFTLSYAPTRGAALAYAIQFRGAADTSASLGTLGLVINEATDAGASTRLSLSEVDWSSLINGAATSGRVTFLGPFGSNILRVHVAQLGLADSYTDTTSGDVSAAGPEMTRLVWDGALNVKALLIYEGPPTNFAGSSGTGSAREVVIVGLSEVV
jgi:hypothetical protein